MIKEIKWKNHPVLGNLELKLTKPDGTAYNTIILAGENGTGKTTILETIAKFLNLGSMEFFEYIKYDDFCINPIENYEKFGFHYRKNEKDATKTEIRTNRSNSPNLIEQDNNDIRHYGIVYTKARSGFNTRQIDSTKNSKIDDKLQDIDDYEDFTHLKQLIIDLYTQDCFELRQIADLNKGISNDNYGKFDESCSIYRFQKAFNNFFDKIQFVGVNNKDYPGIEILFRKNNNLVKIDSLSTGEKQIVFRGTMLLKNLKKLEKGVVLIDEPELSMHPKWQEEILKYYKDLFTNEKNKQTVQMFITTHSDYIIKSALNDKDNNLIIILNDKNGTIEPDYVTSPCILPIITSAEVNYLAFRIYSIDYHAQLYGYLQNRIAQTENTSECSVKHCDDYITQSPLYNSNYAFQSQHPKYGTLYNTLPTYIRNKIDHPDFKNSFTQDQLQLSTEFLRQLCQLP